MFSDVRVRLVLLMALAIACAGDRAEQAGKAATPTPASIELTDDAGQVVRLARPATRIVSLIPSATETLIAIGATETIVGRTRYDVAPEVASLPSVGGGVDPSVEAIVNLHPDLVISWESDKRQAIRQKLIGAGIAVYILRTQDTTDIFHGIAAIGRMAGRDSAATAIANAVRDTLRQVQQSVLGLPVPSVFYVVYNDPPMTAGPKTFIGELIGLAGGRSIFTDTTQLWANLALEEVVRLDPDLLIVPVSELRTNSLERFQKLAGWRDLRAVKTGRVVSVPSDLLSRPSPSIAQASQVLRNALHPDAAPK